jgi:hypothetical protein
MAKFATFDDSDFQDFVATFENAAKGEAVARAIETALSTTGKAGISKVKRLTPVDTGNLRRTWQVSNIKRNGKSFTIEFSNNTEYAPYIEYGHRVVIHGKTVGFRPGKFMLRKTVDALTKTFYKNAGKALEEALEEILG